MGTLYIAIPSNNQIRAWFEELGLSVDDLSDGRLPTGEEIRAVVKKLTGYQVDFRTEEGDEIADITSAVDPHRGPWAVLAFPKAGTHQEQGPHLTFRKGWPEVMIPLLHLLSMSSGPIVLVPDTGGDPLLVHSAADPTTLLNAWGT